MGCQLGHMQPENRIFWAAVFNFKLTKRRETRMVDKGAKLRHQPWVIITPFGVLHYSP